MLKSGFPHSCLASPGPLSKFKPNHQDKVGLGVGKEGSSAPHRRGLGRGHPLLPRPQLNGQIQMCHPEPSGDSSPREVSCQADPRLSSENLAFPFSSNSQ